MCYCVRCISLVVLVIIFRCCVWLVFLMIVRLWLSRCWLIVNCRYRCC